MIAAFLGNPWYRQSRNGDVQGRSGGAPDKKVEGNPIGPNLQPAGGDKTGPNGSPNQ